MAYTSALTTAIAANGIKIFLISSSALAAGVSDPLSWFGILLVIVAVVIYAYLGYQEGQAAERAKLAANAANAQHPILQAQAAGVEVATEKSALVGGNKA